MTHLTYLQTMPTQQMEITGRFQYQAGRRLATTFAMFSLLIGHFVYREEHFSESPDFPISIACFTVDPSSIYESRELLKKCNENVIGLNTECFKKIL